jgi:hypothetical protein
MFFLATTSLMSVAAMGAVILGDAMQQRDREVELLYVGDQMSQAIFSYQNSASASGLRMPPQALSDLVWDTRSPTPVAHLRRIYIDPLTGSFDWGEIKDPSGALIGVFSKSKLEPLKKIDFAIERKFFEKAKTYADWKFSPFPNLVQ